MSILFGQNGWAFMRGMAHPRWFIEGDAVLMETALTNGGRGRVPAFDMEYKALRLNNRKYSYEKASAFSLKDFVPDHYKLGYYMTSYARNKYGKSIWNTVVDESARYKGIFFPFSRSLKKNTGLSTPKMYKKTMAELDSIWQAEAETLALTNSQQINQKKKRVFTNYQFVNFFKDQLIVEKSGFDQVRTFYSIDEAGNEKKLFEPGFNISRNT